MLNVRGRLHGDQRRKLEQVVLEHVPRGAGLLVELAAAVEALRLGDGDLHVVDVAAVPDRLEDPVAEPEDHQVADRLLAQVMVDAEDLGLAEDLPDLAVQPDRGLEVVAERLLDDDPPPAAVVGLVVEADAPELADDRREGRLLGGQVEQHVAVGSNLGVDLLESFREAVEVVGVLEVDALVRDPLAELGPDGLIDRLDARVLRHRRAHLGAELHVVIGTTPDGDEPELVRQQVRPPELEQRRHQLAMREIAGRAEEHEHAWVGHPLEAEALAQRVRRRWPARPATTAGTREPELPDRGRRRGRLASRRLRRRSHREALLVPDGMSAELIPQRGEHLGAIAVVLA